MVFGLLKNYIGRLLWVHVLLLGDKYAMKLKIIFADACVIPPSHQSTIWQCFITSLSLSSFCFYLQFSLFFRPSKHCQQKSMKCIQDDDDDEICASHHKLRQAASFINLKFLQLFAIKGKKGLSLKTEMKVVFSIP